MSVNANQDPTKQDATKQTNADLAKELHEQMSGQVNETDAPEQLNEEAPEANAQVDGQPIEEVPTSESKAQEGFDKARVERDRAVTEKQKLERMTKSLLKADPSRYEEMHGQDPVLINRLMDDDPELGEHVSSYLRGTEDTKEKVETGEIELPADDQAKLEKIVAQRVQAELDKKLTPFNQEMDRRSRDTFQAEYNNLADTYPDVFIGDVEQEVLKLYQAQNAMAGDNEMLKMSLKDALLTVASRNGIAAKVVSQADITDAASKEAQKSNVSTPSHPNYKETAANDGYSDDPAVRAEQMRIDREFDKLYPKAKEILNT